LESLVEEKVWFTRGRGGKSKTFHSDVERKKEKESINKIKTETLFLLYGKKKDELLKRRVIPS